MNKQKQYIDFKVIKPFIHNTKRLTVTCAIISLSSGEQLGIIKWYGPWRQYCFYPNDDTLWNDGCLENVQSILKGLTFAQRHKKDLGKLLVSQ